MSTRKYLFGHKKRKKKRKTEEFIQSQLGAMDKFLNRNIDNIIKSSNTDLVDEEVQNEDDQVQDNVESVKAIRFQAPELKAALNYLVETCDDPNAFRDAKSLSSDLIDFEFLFGMIIWYTILSAINRVSKMLQSKDMVIDAAICHLKGLISFFETYRETGFESDKIAAKEIAAQMEIAPTFHKNRIIHRKKQFDKNVNNEITHSTKESF